MTRKIKDHFKKNDPILFSYIERVKLQDFKPAENLFADLCESIVSQQLSEKAGSTIFNRFLELFPRRRITPQKTLELAVETIRKCGISHSKINFLKDLAVRIHKKDLDLEALRKLPDKEVIIQLTKVNGIGPWTAEMFLMFGLGREDIFSHGDLGLKRAIERIYKFKKEPTRQQVEKLIKNWIPYRTYAARILWKTLSL